MMIKDKENLYKWEVLAILWLAFLINQGDRQIFNVVLPLIRDDLGLSEAQLGLIASIFILVLAITVPFAGYLGDIYSRKWICTSSVIFWSLATMFTGISTLPIHLILLRSVATAGGEALFAPANYALIADYHKKSRSTALSIHQTSVYIGVVLSGFLAGWIGERYGWEMAFYIFGAVGVLLGIIMVFRLKDPVNENDQKSQSKRKVSFKETLPVVFKNPTAILLIIGFAGMIFVHVGFLTWTPTFLHEKYNLSLSSAGFNSMFYMNAFAFIGVLLSGRISDKMVKINQRFRIKIQYIGMLLTVPFLFLIGINDIPLLTYAFLAGFGLFRGIYDANIYASLYDVIPAKYRSSGSGIMIMFGFAAGAVSPFLLGYIKPIQGLSFGFIILSLVSLLSALALWVAYKFFFKKDFYINEKLKHA